VLGQISEESWAYKA